MADNPNPPVGVTQKGGYAFIRSSDTWGPNSIPWKAIADAGLTPVIASNDPHLAEVMAAGSKTGITPGVWIPAGGEGDPKQYAAQVASIYNKYGPSVIIPNIEFAGKGYGPREGVPQGDAGWQWDEAMMSELQRLGIPPNMAVAMLPNQDDFNYGAFTSRGVRVMPEAFGANTGTDLFDPAAIKQTLLKNGVPENMIDVLLAPKQAGTAQGSVFTWDDLSPGQVQALSALGVTRPSAVTDPGAPTTAADAAVDSTPTRVADADNPAAVAYANTRLKGLAAQGITAQRYGLEGLDPTAQWRALSAIVGAQQAIKSGHAQDYHVGANVPTSVADYVNKLLTAATTPDTQGVNDDPRRTGVVAPQAPGSTKPMPTAAGVLAPGRPMAFGPGPHAAPATAPANHGAAPTLVAQAAQGQLSPAAVKAVLDIKRNPPGELAPAMQRIGPMQQALASAAGVRVLRATREPV